MAPRRLSSFVALLLTWLFAGTAAAAQLTVYFFDVGQGDSALIVSPAGKTVLIDAGPPEAGEHLAQRLKQILTAPVDLMVMTHPHADHLGGMERVLGAVGARIFMEPGIDHASPLYSQLLRALEEKKVPVKIGEAGRNVDLGGGASLHLLAPFKPPLEGTRSDTNANSIVMRLTYGHTSFYLAADSEPETEQRILRAGEELSCDVYKVAHHASRYASTKPMLAKLRPRFAIISVGANNDYGHPTRATLDRLEAVGAKVYRTDLDGEIVVRSDGAKVQVTTEHGGPTEQAAVPAPEVGSERRDGSRARASKPQKAAKEVVAEPAAEPQPEPATETTKPAQPARAAEAPRTLDPAAASPAAQQVSGYVASVNSTVFHKPDCRNAERIKPSNLVTYRSREEAVAAGRRPAKDCNP